MPSSASSSALSERGCGILPQAVFGASRAESSAKMATPPPILALHVAVASRRRPSEGHLAPSLLDDYTISQTHPPQNREPRKEMTAIRSRDIPVAPPMKRKRTMRQAPPKWLWRPAAGRLGGVSPNTVRLIQKSACVAVCSKMTAEDAENR